MGGGGYECQNLSSCGLATLKQPPGRCGDAEGVKDLSGDTRNQGLFTHPVAVRLLGTRPWGDTEA